jgi:bifunctional non-homologous end joining protein LigD
VALTNPQKRLFSRAGVTKVELASYYEEVAERMLPHLSGRLLTLLRCPESEARGCFFQKHATGSEPDGVESTRVREAAKTDSYLYVEDVRGLVGLALMGVLEVHVWGSRRDRLERPDRLVFDLDPGPGVPFAAVARAARDLRRAFERLDLASFALLTGSRGVHVVLPLDRRADFGEVRRFAKAVAERLEAEQPARFVARASPSLRRGRIFVDYLRNARGATAVCPYSTRALPDAPVATPVAWSYLDRARASDAFTVRGRLPADPWKGYFRVRQTLPKSGSR